MNRPLEVVAKQQEQIAIPPQALEAEQSLLGGLMLDNRKFDDITPIVSDGDFYSQNHRLIFSATGKLITKGDPADVLTVSERLESDNQLDAAGGFAYLGTIANNTTSVANIKAYARVVREKSIKRNLIAAGNDIAAAGYSNLDSQECLEIAERKITEFSDRKASTGLVRFSELLHGVFDAIEERSNSDSAIAGLSTGFIDLDARTGGLKPGELTVIAGRPSMGKTSLAMNIAEYAAIVDEKTVAIFSLEMSSEQIISRCIASLGRIPSQAINGKMSDDYYPRLNNATGLLDKADIYINDDGWTNPLDVASKCRKLYRKKPVDLVVIDYLQLFEGGQTQNKADEIGDITRAFKRLAIELKCPVILLSQLNRSLENRPDKRPKMSDLRSSGSIEQDADVIFFIYRDEVYNEDTSKKGIAEILTAKNRNGPIGQNYLTFLGEHFRFENFTGVIPHNDPRGFSGGLD